MRDDWTFPNWDPAKDYTDADYYYSDTSGFACDFASTNVAE